MIQLQSDKKFNSVSWLEMDSYARINRETGDLFLNPKFWPDIKPHFQRFFELHEYGHFYLKTDSEEEANKYALDHFVRYENQDQTIQDLVDLAEIKVWLKKVVLNPHKKLTTNVIYSDVAPIVAAGLVSGGFNLIGSIFGGGQRKKEREAQERANLLMAQQAEAQRVQELNVLQQQKDILKLQSELKEDEQEAENKKIILIGGISGGVIVLILALFIIKKANLMKKILLIVILLILFSGSFFGGKYLIKYLKNDRFQDSKYTDSKIIKPRTIVHKFSGGSGGSVSTSKKYQKQILQK